MNLRAQRFHPWRFLSTRLGHTCLGMLFTLAFLAPALAEEEEPKPPAAKGPRMGTSVASGVGREGMWPAPTAADWAKPCMIPFQRTWTDALAVAKESGKPILICINMDGEIASEHWAGIRYRQPDVGTLYAKYVTVIASVYRHTPRDFDEQGRRILCPRFGSVTCGEHIAIEPVIFEKFCDGRRIAPRHIAVDIGGKEEAYDAYYVNDTAGVFDAIIDGREKFAEAKPPIVRGDRPILERVASRHLDDRKAVEAAYQKGDAAQRKALLEAAAKHKDAAQLDLMRLAIFGLDPDLGQTARTALAKTDAPQATTLISEALQTPMAQAERDALIGALGRLGKTSALARWLAGVHGGLDGGGKSTLDVEGWRKAAKGEGVQPTAGPGGTVLVSKAEERAQAAYETPLDPAARVSLAESTLALAIEAPAKYANDQRRARMWSQHLYADARKTAEEAERLGAKGWRLDMVIAVAAYYTGDKTEAYKRAAPAVAAMPSGDGSWTTMALVSIFAESRWTTIKRAVKAGDQWPSQYLRDLHAAYGILLRHPMGTPDQVVWHYEFLLWLGADWRASRVLDAGIRRFDDSLPLHKRLRERVLKKSGAKAVEDAYAKMLTPKPTATLASYAGFASVFVAEHYRRGRRYTLALAAYGRGIEHYEMAARLDKIHARGAAHVIALAHAARARVAYQLDQDELALGEILISFERSPRSAGTRDGMGITPGETAQMLLARLKATEQSTQAKELEAALADLERELLAPDIGLGSGK